MSDFKAKMHQIRFRLGLLPRPRWGSLQRSPDPLAGFEGPTSKGGEGREKGGMRGEGREEKEGRKERGGEGRRGGLSGNVAEEAFCLKSAPARRRDVRSENWKVSRENRRIKNFIRLLICNVKHECDLTGFLCLFKTDPCPTEIGRSFF